MDLLNQTKAKMTATLEHFKTELKGVRTGRANPAILDSVTIEVYGAKMRLKELASITTPEPRTLLVTPFDRQNTSVIGKAIEKANLGFQPIVEGNVVRLKIPQMDANTRNEMVKICRKWLEDTKVKIRNVRRESNEIAKKQKVDGELEEDAFKKLEKHIQEDTDKFCKEADLISEKKEKEIAEI